MTQPYINLYANHQLQNLDSPHRYRCTAYSGHHYNEYYVDNECENSIVRVQLCQAL